MRGGIRRWLDEWRPSVITLGAPVYPLAVLFGLNAVDELDRAAFAVLLPDIRDHLDLSNAGALRLVALTTIAVLLIEIPLSFYCDRGNRVRIATIGAAIWALFSIGTGAAITVTSIGLLVAMRVGAGTGRSVVTPTHSSLLADYYEPAARVKVFSAHRQANSVGQILGPLLGGLIAKYLGLAWPFYLFAIPTLVFVVMALRMREPIRGYHERKAGGADEAAALVAEQHETVRSTMKVLYRVRTIRRIWLATPFLAVALFGVPNLLALVYEDVFNLDSAARGAIAAGVEPLQVVGVFLAMPRVAKIALTDPGFLLRYVGVVGVIDGFVLVVLAYSPNLAVAIAMHAIVAASIGTLAPAFFALVSIVAPARVRAASFSTISVFAIPGIAVFLPIIGAVSDKLSIQASMVVLVPIGVTASFILASASRFVTDDIAAAHAPPPDELTEELAEADTFDSPLA
jgi:branched-chain amino acid transport system ATP-binding protein